MKVKKSVASLAMVITVLALSLLPVGLWAAITPTAPEHRCFEKFLDCTAYAALQATWYERAAAEADCELDLAACIESAVKPW